MCVNSSYLFGCVGLKAGAKYCILNKQYSESDYFQLVEQIKSNMRKLGEYGEFFPLSISLFGYNNTVSFDEHECTKSEVLAKGWKWEDAVSGMSGKGDLDSNSIPGNIAETNESICKNILTCQQCQRNYRITNQEFAFYKAEDVPVPLRCPDCRHRNRLAGRNRKKMQAISCADCHVEVITTLDPNIYGRIVCQTCHSKTCY